MAADDIFGSSKTIEWGTPDDVVNMLGAIYPIVLDVCATPGRQKRPFYFAPPDDLIGRYKEGKEWKTDEEFKAWAMAQKVATPPLAVDGLAQDWAAILKQLGGCGWMNPPFGNEIKHWVRKAAETALAGGCVVTLLPSRTGTKWWHEWVEPVRTGQRAGALDFWKGRIAFSDRNGADTVPAPFDVAIVVFGSVA